MGKLHPPPAERPPGEPLLAYMFKMDGKGRYALSNDPSGRNLPRGGLVCGEWEFVRAVELLQGEVRPGFDGEEAARALREDGYALIGYPFMSD
jgi:hypothetical protein